MSAPVRVLLLWPGTGGAASGNFGVPQLVSLATWLRERAGAAVTVVDLMAERAFGPVNVADLVRGYDVVCVGVYSSYDHLKCMAIAQVARQESPRAVIVAGGYHASARPQDIVYDGSPFDVCIVGEAERPLLTVVESVAGGAPLRGEVLGSDPVEDLSILPPTDWSYLARYRPIARKVASQAQVYLSRGCPFDCAFCMERAKREVSWRALPVERALDEVKRLHDFLDLSTWTLYLADALFGMKTSWRRQFLEGLARMAIPVRKYWLLIRVDLVDDEDLRLFADANCGLGFGLESGDPSLLATIRKAGRLDTYLDRMEQVASWARVRDVPWGANVIVGHPGETEGSLRRSAAYLSKLFLRPEGTTGFLSVDPFRIYPGSPIDGDRGWWESRFGTRFHRPHWWDDGDPEFLSEWVDPSSTLSYRERERLSHELLGPIVREIPERFVYQGPAREYFLRAATDQRDMLSPRYRLHFADRYYAWMRYTGRSAAAERERMNDPGLAEVCRALRGATVPKALAVARVDASTPRGAAIERALLEVPRESFVPLDAVRASVDDEPVALDRTGAATVSAMHAYARNADLLEVGEGDTVLDLGAGTGYGAALFARLVGPSGRVHGVELDPSLAAKAERALGEVANATVRAGDAIDPRAWGVEGVAKVTVGFALSALPEAWREALPLGAVVVAPVGEREGQWLVRATVTERGWSVERLEAVRYVSARRVEDLPRPEASERGRDGGGRRALPVV